MQEPGITRALADQRASQLSDVRYALHLAIPRDRRAPIEGTASITFAARSAAEPVVLDFRPGRPAILSLKVNGVEVDPSTDAGHVVVDASAIAPGPNELRIAFIAGDGPLNRREDHLYSIFVPARAHEAFPCFDQPNLKARFTLTLDVPEGWTAVSNTESRTTQVVAGGTGGTVTRITFEETAPLPTYLFAFAAGSFDTEQTVCNGRGTRLYYHPSRRDRVAVDRETIVGSHAAALRWLEDYTDSPYPFSKLDIVLLPSFQFGGMEHPGAIFYNADALLLEPSATRQQQLARAHVIAHETAHMWFGDLVTMTWFDDVWMKEVFANFMAAKIVNPWFADLDHDLRFVHAHHPAAYEIDRTAGANAIRQPLENLKDAGTLYGPIIYLKSPILMRQLELVLGEAPLRDVLREYLQRFRYGNASWSDLGDLLAVRAPIDVNAWGRDWIDTAGRPRITTNLVFDGEDRLSHIELRTSREDDAGVDADADANGACPSVTRWPQRLDVVLGRGHEVSYRSVWLDGAARITGLAQSAAPDYVLAAGRGVGYGDFRLDARSRAWLVSHLTEISDPLTRGVAWLTLWDELLSGTITPAAITDLALRAIQIEPSELNLQRMLICVERLFWLFHSAPERAAIAGPLEAALLASLSSAETTTARATVFASLRSTASSESLLAWLDEIWSGRAHVDGLPLTDGDMVALALELAVRRPDGDELISRQAARMNEGDRRDALAFIAPAVSSDQGRRDRFFAMLSDAANRRREPWVVDGMRWLHHPLRAAASLKYLQPGLELLEEVKRTGDIFLPRRWVDAMVSGHRSSEAARCVRSFLDTRPPAFPPSLRRLVLASADLLLRLHD